MISIENLINKYVQYLHAKFDIEKITTNSYEIVTPFLDRRNDKICIYALLNDDDILLTDDGYTLSDLEISGIDIDTKKRSEEIKKILLGYGIKRDGRELSVNSRVDNYAQKQHNLIQALLTLNDLYLTSRTNIISIFFEEVLTFLDEEEIVYVNDINLTGKSGLSHKFDFLIPKQTRKSNKEALIKTINNPKKNNIETTLFLFDDIRNSGRDEDAYVVLNDREQKVNRDMINALRNYNIQPVFWSEKEEIKAQLELQVA